jgi:holo-[acyl-carrier protein] synthase
MNLRCGVDLIEIKRISSAVERHGDRILNRLFTLQELQDCGERPGSLAVRFAAKEAVAKTLGTGIGQVRWQDIEICRQASGEPHLRLHGEAAKIADHLGLQTWAISLSHTESIAIAFVVAGD